MRSPPALLIILPGWALAYLTPPPLSRSVAAPGAGSALPQKPSTGCTPFLDSPGGLGGTANRRRARPSIHGSRCSPLFRKGFSKGGLGKQGELMELMAKAKRDRAKKELEDRLRESGDLPDENSKPIKPTGANIKAERSWRDGGATSTTTAGGDKAADPVASAQTAAGAGASPQNARTTGAAGKGAGASRTVVDPGGIGSRVWPSTRIEGRPNDVYFEYDELLEATEDHSGTRVSPELENPRASYAEYENLRNKAQWEAVLAGRPSVANRSPVVSKSEYDDFESMLTHGTPSRSRGQGDGVVSPEVLERKILQEMEKQAPVGFSAGEFAPLDPWRALSDTDGGKVNFGLYRGIRPLLVVADPRQGSSEMREAMQQLNTRMPRKLVDVVAVTSDSSGVNRKTVKKGRISFPVLSDDEAGTWMLAYRLKSPSKNFDKTAFLIEPDLGTILNVWAGFDVLSLVDLVKDSLKA